MLVTATSATVADRAPLGSCFVYCWVAYEYAELECGEHSWSIRAGLRRAEVTYRRQSWSMNKVILERPALVSGRNMAFQLEVGLFGNAHKPMMYLQQQLFSPGSNRPPCKMLSNDRSITSGLN